LGAQKADKKLLLVLTDGEPADVDMSDPQALILDTRQAVKELTQQGIHSHCISLDPNADAYVRDIFGHHFTVVDRVDQLPERFTQAVHGAHALNRARRQAGRRYCSGKPRRSQPGPAALPAMPSRTLKTCVKPCASR
jgi:hypothetical protein